MSKPAANRLLGIDALRGVAALLVLVYHARAIPWIGMSEFFHLHRQWSWNPDVWLGWITTPFRAGFLGVQLLFVLSGYCIHRNQARGLAAGELVKLDLPRYAFRRFFRIYPTYVAALIFSGLVLFKLVPWLGTQGFPIETQTEHHSWYVFLMNLLTLQDILVPPYEGVFWSLSVEIHLYIAYPFILWVTRKYGPGKMLLVSLAAGILYTAAGCILRHQPTAITCLSFLHFTAYWFTWCAGAYVAEMQVGRAKPPKLPKGGWTSLCILFALGGTGLYLVAMLWPEKNAGIPLAPVGEFLLAVAVTGFLHAALLPRADRLWTSLVGRSLAFVGMFSYSLYAVHVPILTAFTALFGGKHESISFAFLGCLSALVVAFGFFYLVERWTLTPPKGFFATKKRIHPAPIVAASAEVPVGQG